MIRDPVPSNVPPQLAEYHFHEAPVPNDPPTSERSVDDPLQIGLTVALILVGATDKIFTVIVMESQTVVLQVPSALT